MSELKSVNFGIVKKSPIGGRGVFAVKDFFPGDVLGEIAGSKVTVDELERRFLSGNDRVTCDAFQVDEHFYIDMDDPYLYLNHSCNPLVGILGFNTIVALKPIKEGQEITYDYSATEWTPCEYDQYDPNSWPLRCNCGAPSCRKIVTCFPYLPQELRLKYLDQGVIQDYILRKLLSSNIEQRCLTCEKVIHPSHFVHFSVDEIQLAKKGLSKSTLSVNQGKRQNGFIQNLLNIISPKHGTNLGNSAS